MSRFHAAVLAGAAALALGAFAEPEPTGRGRLLGRQCRFGTSTSPEVAKKKRKRLAQRKARKIMRRVTP